MKSIRHIEISFAHTEEETAASINGWSIKVWQSTVGKFVGAYKAKTTIKFVSWHVGSRQQLTEKIKWNQVNSRVNKKEPATVCRNFANLSQTKHIVKAKINIYILHRKKNTKTFSLHSRVVSVNHLSNIWEHFASFDLLYSSPFFSLCVLSLPVCFAFASKLCSSHAMFVFPRIVQIENIFARSIVCVWLSILYHYLEFLLFKLLLQAKKISQH